MAHGRSGIAPPKAFANRLPLRHKTAPTHIRAPHRAPRTCRPRRDEARICPRSRNARPTSTVRWWTLPRPRHNETVGRESNEPPNEPEKHAGSAAGTDATRLFVRSPVIQNQRPSIIAARRGKSVMIPSTPSSTSRRISASSLITHACTSRSTACATSTNCRVMTVMPP